LLIFHLFFDKFGSLQNFKHSDKIHITYPSTLAFLDNLKQIILFMEDCMKISKLLNVVVILVVLITFLPVKEVKAAIPITSNTTISKNATWTEDMVVTNGAVLTISPGVTITVNCSDSPILSRYPSEKDPDKIELIIENGTLIADRVTFKGATAGSCWYGIEILDNGSAQITRSTIRDARVGITIDKSSAVISSNTINNIRGVDSDADLNRRDARGILVTDGDDGIIIENNTIDGVYGGQGPLDATPSVPNAGGVAYGIKVERTNNITVRGNHIEDIYGGDGKGFTYNASAGYDGSDGVDFTSPIPIDGGMGGHGNKGGDGGYAYGIAATEPSDATKTITISNNTVSKIYGGEGANGQWGGNGGDGGDAGFVSSGPVPVDGVPGGVGGAGGNGGAGGFGGKAYGIYLVTVTASISENQINTLRGGQAGTGGLGGDGGSGGNGGSGSIAEYDTNPAECVAAGDGGDGGRGGDAGSSGQSGSGGEAYGVLINNGTLTVFSHNILHDISGKPGGAGTLGNNPGSGGDGGWGGPGSQAVPLGGGGGAGGAGGLSGTGGNGGDGGSAIGLRSVNSTVSSIEANSFSLIVSGIGGVGGNGGNANSTQGVGGLGGNVSSYPNEADIGVEGGVGGVGSPGGEGGDGGKAGDAYAVFATVAMGSTTVVNNLVYFVHAPNGGAGGNGGIGGKGGGGGSGIPFSGGTNQPGGDGGAGGAAGNGGDGGDNVPGSTLFNASGFYLSSTDYETSTWLVTNNTIANISSENVTPLKGLKGTPGLGGAGGTGDPAGNAGAVGAAGGDGNLGVKGQTGGYYSGPYVTSDLYNNIIAHVATETISNSVGIYKHLDGVITGFRYGDLFGWQVPGSFGLMTGTINADPLFADFTTQDYRLQAGSPCVDTGLNTAPGVPDVDIAGTGRPFGPIVDMGAYEYDPSTSVDYDVFLPLIVK
jgi:hypothetical protein